MVLSKRLSKNDEVCGQMAARLTAVGCGMDLGGVPLENFPAVLFLPSLIITEITIDIGSG